MIRTEIREEVRGSALFIVQIKVCNWRGVINLSNRGGIGLSRGRKWFRSVIN